MIKSSEALAPVCAPHVLVLNSSQAKHLLEINNKLAIVI